MENPQEKISIKMIPISYANNKNNILNMFAMMSITTCVILFAIHGITVDSIEMNWNVITSIIFISILAFCGLYNMLETLFGLPSIFTSIISNSGVVLGLIKHFKNPSKFNKMEGRLNFMGVVTCLSIYAFLMMWIRVSGTDYTQYDKEMEKMQIGKILSDYGYISFLLVVIIPLMLFVFPKIQWTGYDSIFEARYVACAMILPILALLMPVILNA